MYQQMQNEVKDDVSRIVKPDSDRRHLFPFQQEEI